MKFLFHKVGLVLYYFSRANLETNKVQQLSNILFKLALQFEDWELEYIYPLPYHLLDLRLNEGCPIALQSKGER